ncbi:OB-fold domain-containing protein [Arthrobacter sp. FW305-123]|nr:OB-fold domain-containing protein [Arthrobacter sp. FW305-123]
MTVAGNAAPTHVETIPVTACSECKFRSATPAAACPLCGAAAEQRSTQAIGTVWSHTLVHLPHGTNTNGYRLVYVDLDDGPRILCQQAADAASVKVDDRVRISLGDDDIFTVKGVEA